MSSSAIPPAPPPVPVTSTAAGVPVLTVAVGSASEALARLPPGALVMAALDAVEAKGLVQVTTADGTSLQLRLPPTLSLPPNAELSLQLIQQGGTAAFKLLAVNGRPTGAGGLPGLSLSTLPSPMDLLAPGQAKPGTAGHGQAMMAGAAQASGAPPLQPGPLGLAATVLRPNPAGAKTPAPGGLPGLAPGQSLSPPPGMADLAPGTRLTVRIAVIAPPGAGTAAPPLAAPQPQAGEPARPTPAAASQPPTAGAPPAVGQQTPQNPGHGQNQTPGQGPGGPPAQPQTPPASPQQASAPQAVPLPGTVISHSPGGAALVQTPAGLLSLAAGPPMPAGSTVMLEVVGPPSPPPPPAPQAAQPQGLSSEGWPTLQSSVDVLAQSDRQAADQLIRMIPQATPRLAAAMSLLASAVRSGDFKGLGLDGIGRGLDKAGRRDLADRLRRDLQDLTDEASRPRGDGDWQAITLPFAHGAQVDPVRLFVQRVSGEDKRQDGAKGSEQRFILEVEMSRLGRIQFDGLVQKDAKRFDLIVRSELPLDSDIRRDISGIFAESAQLTGIKGTIGFQSGRGFVELPPADTTGTRIVV